MSNQPTHVLLIEDSQGDAALIRMRLLEANSDLEVSSADRLSTGLAALDGELPAVVLLDLNLPDSRGAETFRKILQKAPAVPVVVLSGIDDEELAVQAVHQGVQDYVVKGAMDSRQLLRTLRYAIARQTRLAALDMTAQSARLRRGHSLVVQCRSEVDTKPRPANPSRDPHGLNAALCRKQFQIKQVQEEIGALNSTLLLLIEESEHSVLTRACVNDPHIDPDTKSV